MAPKIITVNEVSIISVLFLDFGRKRTRAVFKPNMLKLVTRVVSEINVVAKPICSGVKSLVHKVQKINPIPDIKKVLAIRYIALR